METLLDTITRYAEENLVIRFQREAAEKAKAAQRRADELTNKLNALGPEAETWVEELKVQWDEISGIHSLASLRSGISVGLELGRLQLNL